MSRGQGSCHDAPFHPPFCKGCDGKQARGTALPCPSPKSLLQLKA